MWIQFVLKVGDGEKKQKRKFVSNEPSFTCPRPPTHSRHYPIIIDGYASLFNCTTAVRASDAMTASS